MKCELLCASGVPGIGKSAVLSHVREWIQRHCDEMGPSTPAILRGFNVAAVKKVRNAADGRGVSSLMRYQDMSLVGDKK